MRYPIAIEIGTETAAYGIVVPDLPGCFSASDTLEEATTNAGEAAAAWIDAALDSGEPIPSPSSLDALRADARFAGWSFGVIDIAAQSAGRTRSGYIAEMTLRAE